MPEAFAFLEGSYALSYPSLVPLDRKACFKSVPRSTCAYPVTDSRIVPQNMVWFVMTLLLHGTVLTVSYMPQIFMVRGSQQGV